MKEIKLNKLLLIGAFLIYILLLIWVIALKFNAKWIPEQRKVMEEFTVFERIKLPFEGYINAIKTKSAKFAYKDYFFNILLYIPLGIYLKILIKEKKMCYFIALFSSVCFELIQLITCIGGFDPLDILSNYLGGAIGVVLYIKFRKNLSDKVINILNFLVAIIFGPVLVYAIINTVLNINLYMR